MPAHAPGLCALDLTRAAERIGRLECGRSWPDRDVRLMFEPDKWPVARIMKRPKPPDKALTLNKVPGLMARLGGFLARKECAEPGTKIT